MAKNNKSKQLKGIGGWLLVPLIGLCVTVIINLADLIDTVLYYDLGLMMGYLFMNALFIVVSSLTLFFIFTKSKEARVMGMVTYVIFGIGYIFEGFYFAAIGSLIWFAYFYSSERVRNTFVK